MRVRRVFLFLLASLLFALVLVGCKEEDSPSKDTTSPSFEGLVSATGISNTQIALAWDAATDDVTPSTELAYDVYMSETETGFEFSHPTYTTTPGALSHTVFGLQPGTTYWFVVRARDGAGNRDDNMVVQSGTTLAGDDVTPPVFSGVVVAEAVSGSRINLLWGAAVDETTPTDAIVYDIYQAPEPGGQNFTAPAYTTEPGDLSFTVTGLDAATTYYFVVRARDEAGNQDQNTEERSASTFAESDVTPPDFEGLESATAVSDMQIQLIWPAASDDETAEGDIVYLIYQAETSGGQNLDSPDFVTDPGVTTVTIDGLNPGEEYFFVVRARDEADNVDSNTVEQSATTLSEPDTTPPNFTGVISATAVSSSAVDLTWNAAADNVTPESGIVYDIYYSTLSEGQNFSVPNVSTPPGVLAHTVTGLSPSTTYYFVVRARDGAGNRDVNLVERNATTEEADTTPPIIVSDNFDTGGALVSGTTSFTVSVTFSEEVTGVDAGNVTINNGATLADFSTSDGLTFNFTATGLTDGTRYTVSFSSGIQDLSQNALAPTSRELYVAANVLYVRPGGSGVQDGTSPADALPLVSQALVLAAEGTDIYVQGGDYSDSITLKEGVNIYGGYDPSFTVRDPVNNESILSQSAFDTTVTAIGVELTLDTVVDGMTFSNNYNGSRAVLRVSGGAGVTVRNSRLFLPAAACYSQAVVDVTSGSGNSLVMEGSIVSGGGLSNNYCTRSSHGVYFFGDDSYLRLDGNIISEGDNNNTHSSYTYRLYAVSVSGHTIEIVNNVINGGGSGGAGYAYSHGIYSTTSTNYEKLVIANNTISGGKGGYRRYAVHIAGTISANQDIRLGNNVIFNGSEGSYSYGIYRSTSSGILSRVENNMITSVGVYLRSGADYTTLSSMETYLTSVGTTAGFNKEVASYTDLYFQDYDSMDWRPTSQSPLGLTQGGRDTSAEDWGAVVTDLLGNPRTLLYSIGAYEYD